jgi:hypothetical protein
MKKHAILKENKAAVTPIHEVVLVRYDNTQHVFAVS